MDLLSPRGGSCRSPGPRHWDSLAVWRPGRGKGVEKAVKERGAHACPASLFSTQQTVLLRCTSGPSPPYLAIPPRVEAAGLWGPPTISPVCSPFVTALLAHRPPAAANPNPNPPSWVILSLAAGHSSQDVSLRPSLPPFKTETLKTPRPHFLLYFSSQQS